MIDHFYPKAKTIKELIQSYRNDILEIEKTQKTVNTTFINNLKKCGCNEKEPFEIFLEVNVQHMHIRANTTCKGGVAQYKKQIASLMNLLDI